MVRWRQVIQPPRNHRVLRHHLEQNIQPFRARTLITCGAVHVDGKSGGLVRITDPNRTISPRQKVYIDRPYPSRCMQAFKRVLARQQREYVFAPGTGQYDRRLARMLEAKTVTKEVPGILTLPEIFEYLRFQAPQPIDTIHIGAHSFVGGALMVPHATDAPGTNFDELQALAARDALSFTDAEIYPRPQADPRRRRIDIHIRGCQLGVARPFLQLLKDAVWARIADRSAVGAVTAPRHMHVTGRFSLPGQLDGATEFMLYKFTATSRRPLTRRSDILRLFARSGFRLADGRPVPPQRWNEWIPTKGLHLEHSTPTLVVHPLDGQKHQASAGYRFRQVDARFMVPVTATTAVPSTQGARRAWVLANAKQSVAAGRLPPFEEDHPFPIFRRAGFATLDDYINAFDWQPGQVGTSDFIVGKRALYEVVRPVVDRRGRLYVNFYPIRVGFPRIMMKEDDARFFESV